MKIGPGRNSKSRVFWSKTDMPVTSVGWRSGVHWIREIVDAVDAAADRAGEHRLRRAGHVLEQHVAAAHQRGEDELDLLALAVDDRLDVVEQARRDVDRGAEAIGFLRARSTPDSIARDPSRTAPRRLLSRGYAKASAPPTTSRISCVISAWRARFICSVRVSISSPAFLDAFRIAVIRAPCSDAADSSSAR